MIALEKLLLVEIILENGILMLGLKEFLTFPDAIKS